MTGAEVRDRNRGVKIGRVWEKVWRRKRRGIQRTERKCADTKYCCPHCRFNLFMLKARTVFRVCVCRPCAYSPLMEAEGEEKKALCTFSPTTLWNGFLIYLWMLPFTSLSLSAFSVPHIRSLVLFSNLYVPVKPFSFLSISLVNWQPEGCRGQARGRW